MQAHISDTINMLTALRDKLDSLGDLEERHAKLTADLEAKSSSLNKTNEELEQVKATLTVNQLKSQREFDEAIFAKRKELENLVAQAGLAQQNLAELEAKIRSASNRHTQIEASIDSLRKRLA